MNTLLRPTSLALAALLASTGLASAEIKLSGEARMGILNGFVLTPGADDPTTFSSRARVTFTMTGTTDGGLEFGASFRADNAPDAAKGTAGSVFISGPFGKLSMGDVNGAAQAAMGHVDGVGYTNLSDLNESLFFATGGLKARSLDPAAGADPVVAADPTALYEYSAGDFTFYASATLPGNRYVIGGDTFEGSAYSVAGAYKMGDYKVSLGYERFDSDRVIPAAPAISLKADQLILGVDATFGTFTVKARIGSGNLDSNIGPYADFDQYALSGTYKADALSVTAYMGRKEWTLAGGANLRQVDVIGLGASYDLGGGAAVRGGVVQQEVLVGAGPAQKDTGFDLGLTFKF